MPKMEKVTKGLEECTSGHCYYCPYSNYGERTAYCQTKIDKDALAVIKDQQQKIWELTELNEHLNDKLKSQPQIVRCKDCKHKEESVSPSWEGWCNRLHCGCDNDWFCADGERRTDDA